MTISGLGNGTDAQPAEASAPADAERLRESPSSPLFARSLSSSQDEWDRLRELLLGDDLRAAAAARTRLAEVERLQQALPDRLPHALEANAASPAHRAGAGASGRLRGWAPPCARTVKSWSTRCFRSSAR